MPLIVLEGPEGAGKTTQVALLEKALASRGHQVTTLREPGGTPAGESIRTLLLDPAASIAPATEALLFMAARAQLVRDRVKPALDERVVVILDRFFLSTYAYQIAGRGLPEREIVEANRLASAGLVPDLNVLLTLPADEGLARAGRRGPRDRMEQADAAFHARVAAAFAEFATPAWKSQHPEAGPIVAIDARGAVLDVAAAVLAAVLAAVPSG